MSARRREPLFASSDEEGIAQLIAEAPGRAFRCEPALREVGQRLNLPSGKPPQEAYMNAACLTMLATMGDQAPPDMKGRKALVEAAYVFARARPWLQWEELWRPERDLRVRVKGPTETFSYIFVVRGAAADSGGNRGFYLVGDAETADRFVGLMDSGDHDSLGQLPGIHILFNREPVWAAELMDRATGGTSLIPWPFRTSPTGLVPCSLVDAHILAAVALAFAKLRASHASARIRLETDLGPVIANIERAISG